MQQPKNFETPASHSRESAPPRLRPIRPQVSLQLKLIFAKRIIASFENLRAVLNELSPDQWNALNQHSAGACATCTDCRRNFATSASYTYHLPLCRARTHKLVQTGPFSFEFRPVEAQKRPSVETIDLSDSDCEEAVETTAKRPKLAPPPADLNSSSSSASSDSSGVFSQSSDDASSSPKSAPMSRKAALFSIDSLLQPAPEKVAALAGGRLWQPQLSALTQSHVAWSNQPASSAEPKRFKYEIRDGRKIFRCTYCPRIFSNNSNWRRHENLHGRGQVQECAICGKKFMQKEYLKKHLVTHGREGELVQV